MTILFYSYNNNNNNNAYLYIIYHVYQSWKNKVKLIYECKKYIYLKCMLNVFLKVFNVNKYLAVILK